MSKDKLTPMEQADKDAEECLKLVEEAERTGDMTKLAKAGWTRGYAPNISKDKMLADIKKAAEAHLRLSAIRKKITDKQKAGEEVTPEEWSEFYTTGGSFV